MSSDARTGAGVALPPLVLVNGAPASGKSTLARHLGDELGLPLVAKDTLKEVLFQTIGAPDHDSSHLMGAASYELLWTCLGWMLDGNAGAVVDCNCHRGAEERLAPLLRRARGAIVHCHAAPDELIRRYRERVARGERHPGHFDAHFLARLLGDDDPGYAPLDLPVPTLLVETTSGYAPDRATVVAFVRRALEPPEPLQQSAGDA